MYEPKKIEVDGVVVAQEAGAPGDVRPAGSHRFTIYATWKHEGCEEGEEVDIDAPDKETARQLATTVLDASYVAGWRIRGITLQTGIYL